MSNWECPIRSPRPVTRVGKRTPAEARRGVSPFPCGDRRVDRVEPLECPAAEVVEVDLRTATFLCRIETDAARPELSRFADELGEGGRETNRNFQFVSPRPTMYAVASAAVEKATTRSGACAGEMGSETSSRRWVTSQNGNIHSVGS